MKILIFLVTAVLLAACRPAQFLAERTIERRDTTIYLPGATVRDTLPGVVIHSRDSAFFHTERVVTDATGKAELRYIMDELGRLRIQARCKPDTVHVARIQERIVERPVAVEAPPWWRWVLAGLVVGLVLALVVRLGFS